MTSPVRTARLIFAGAGIYGLVVLTPLFFVETLLCALFLLARRRTPISR